MNFFNKYNLVKLSINTQEDEIAKLKRKKTFGFSDGKEKDRI